MSDRAEARTKSKARRARKIAEADAVLAGRVPYAITIGVDELQGENSGRTRMRAIAYPYDPTVPFRILRKGITEITKVVRVFDGPEPKERARACLARMTNEGEIQSSEYLGFMPTDADFRDNRHRGEQDGSKTKK